jgi:hypothetical protein
VIALCAVSILNLTSEPNRRLAVRPLSLVMASKSQIVEALAGVWFERFSDPDLDGIKLH